MFKLSIYFESEVLDEEDNEVTDQEVIEEILAPSLGQRVGLLDRHFDSTILKNKVSEGYLSFNFNKENSRLETVFEFQSTFQFSDKVEEELIKKASLWAGCPGYFGVDGLEIWHGDDLKIYTVLPCRHADENMNSDNTVSSGKPFKVSID